MGRKGQRRGAALVHQAVHATEEQSADEIGKEGNEGEKVDGETVRSMHEELRDEEDARCNKIQDEANDMKRAVKNLFSVLLVSLPKAVKQLSVDQFCKQYGEEESDLLKAVGSLDLPDGAGTSEHEGALREGGGGGGGGGGGLPGEPRTMLKRKGGSVVGAGAEQPLQKRRALSRAAAAGNTLPPPFPSETPMKKAENYRGTGLPVQTPMTMSRRPRRGEMVISANGSPLGNFNASEIARTHVKEGTAAAPPPRQREVVLETARKKAPGGRSRVEEEPLKIKVDVAGVGVVDVVEAIQSGKLSGEEKRAAKDALKEIMEQAGSVLQQFEA